MKNKWFLLVLISLIWISANNVNHAVTLLEEEKGSYIKNFIHRSEIYPQTPDVWNLTIYNVNYAENDRGESWFFFRFYINGELWWDEYTSTAYRVWLCNKGTAVSRGYQTKGWNILEPQSDAIKVELYRFYNGTSYLEDTAYANITVIMVIPLQHIYALSYFAAYLIACFLILTFHYLAGLLHEE
jgi:hypothetical protein